MGKRKRERREQVRSGQALPYALVRDALPCGNCGNWVPRFQLRRGGGTVLKGGRVLCLTCRNLDPGPIPWKLAMKCEAPSCQYVAVEVCSLGREHVHLLCVQCHQLNHTIVMMSIEARGDPFLSWVICDLDDGEPRCEYCGMWSDVRVQCKDGHDHYSCEGCHVRTHRHIHLHTLQETHEDGAEHERRQSPKYADGACGHHQ